jgi:hypothetical protein
MYASGILTVTYDSTKTNANQQITYKVTQADKWLDTHIVTQAASGSKIVGFPSLYKGNARLTLYDLTTEIVKQINFPNILVGKVWSCSCVHGNKVYAFGENSNQIAVFDVKTEATPTAISLQHSSPGSAACATVRNKIVAMPNKNSQQLQIVDVKTHTVTLLSDSKLNSFSSLGGRGGWNNALTVGSRVVSFPGFQDSQFLIVYDSLTDSLSGSFDIGQNEASRCSTDPHTSHGVTSSVALGERVYAPPAECQSILAFQLPTLGTPPPVCPNGNSAECCSSDPLSTHYDKKGSCANWCCLGKFFCTTSKEALQDQSLVKCSTDGYGINTVGMNECPAGFVPLTSEDACQVAAVNQGQIWEAYSDRGCFVNKVNPAHGEDHFAYYKPYFNGMRLFKPTQLCKKSDFIFSNPSMNQCMVGAVPLATEKECQQTSVLLGARFIMPNRLPPYPNGCFAIKPDYINEYWRGLGKTTGQPWQYSFFNNQPCETIDGGQAEAEDGGVGAGRACVFPFTFGQLTAENRTFYYSCTEADDSAGQPWCGIDSNAEQWGYCGNTCPQGTELNEESLPYTQKICKKSQFNTLYDTGLRLTPELTSLACVYEGALPWTNEFLLPNQPITETVQGCIKKCQELPECEAYNIEHKTLTSEMDTQKCWLLRKFDESAIVTATTSQYSSVRVKGCDQEFVTGPAGIQGCPTGTRQLSQIDCQIASYVRSEILNPLKDPRLSSTPRAMWGKKKPKLAGYRE